MSRAAVLTGRPVTSGIRAGQKFFNNMVLSSIDPGGRKSVSPKAAQ